MRMWRHYVIVVVGSLLLSACQTIEHRSEAITKSSLLPLVQSAWIPKLLWTNSASAGVGKKDAKLRLGLTNTMVVTADYKGNIFMLDRQNGVLKSRLATKQNIISGPAIVGGRVLIGTDNGQILAYQLSDGAFLWCANVMGTVLATPFGTDHLIFVHVLDGSVVALNTKDGKTIWRYAGHAPPLMLRQSSRPVLANNHLIVGFSNGKLKALDPTDGAVEWEREIAISKGRSDLQRMVDISADLVVKDNVVYAVSYQGNLVAVEVDTGTLRWEREFSSYSGLAVSNQAVFVTDAEGVIWAFNRKTGDLLWKAPQLYGRRLSAPALIRAELVVGDDEGTLHWIEQNNGVFSGRTVVDSKGIAATPLVENNIVYVLGQSGKVAALTLVRRDKPQR